MNEHEYRAAMRALDALVGVDPKPTSKLGRVLMDLCALVEAYVVKEEPKESEPHESE